jgi:hypothetical protein
MTVTVDTPISMTSDPPPKRLVWPRLLVGVIVLALLGAGASGFVYAHTYQPLGDGNVESPPIGAGRAISDGVGNPTRYIIVGPAGTVATFGYSIANNGRFSVRILGSGEPSGFFVQPRLSLTYAGLGPGQVPGAFRNARPFPMTLQPGAQINLWITVTKPKCIPGETNEYDAIALRTSSLGVHHDWPFALDGLSGGNFTPFDVCSPAAAVTHIVS